MQQTTALVTRQLLFFLWEEWLCEQDSSEESAFSVNKAQTEEFIASTDNNYQQQCLHIHMNSGGFSL